MFRLCIELNCENCIEFAHHPTYVLRIEPTSSLFTQPAKRTNEFSNSNRNCALIRPTCLTLRLNRKFEATLTHDIHCISVITNQGVHQGKHRHQPFQKLAQLSICWFAIENIQASEVLLYRNFRSSIYESTIIVSSC